MSNQTLLFNFWLGIFLNLAIGTRAEQFILFNIAGRSGPEALQQIHREFGPSDARGVRVGAGAIFSYLRQPREQMVADLEAFLVAAHQTGTPVIIQLDGENWWDGRPDLWNWWDASRPGYAPGNRTNVEWTGWSSEDAIKLAWRNWGRQIRVLPPPNLMSPAYRAACHAEMGVLIPLVLKWWQALPVAQKSLLVGIKLGWESSVGVNAWYYQEGNALLDRPATNDPTNGINSALTPAREVTQIGYAAVKTAGIRGTGNLTAADLAEVVRRHLDDLCRFAAQLGVPREKLFTHTGGWQENGPLYQSGLNGFSCPGWSFYQFAANPLADQEVQRALAKSDAPYWAAAEWWYQGPRETGPWHQALATTLAQPRCHYLCIYNWEDVRNDTSILQAVHALSGNLQSR